MNEIAFCYSINMLYLWYASDWGQDVWAPPFRRRDVSERAETLGNHQSNFYFIEALFSQIQLLVEKASFLSMQHIIILCMNRTSISAAKEATFSSPRQPHDKNSFHASNF